MPTTTDFAQYYLWSLEITGFLALLALLAFLFKWGIRFRLVGITGFMGVVTGALFTLSLVPFTREVIPGAIAYSVVYDNGANQAVIIVPPTIKETEIEPTLNQAAVRLFSYGRLGTNQSLQIVLRTLIHPQPNVSEPLVLGLIRRDPMTQKDSIEVYSDNLSRLSNL